MADAIRELKDKGAALFAKGKYDAALDAYTKAARLASNDVAVHQKIAELQQRLGRKHEAVAAYETLAAMLARGGHLLRAIAACKVILELEPSHRTTQALLADLYAQRQGVQAAPAASPLPSIKHVERDIEIDIAIEPVQPAPGGPPPVPLFSSLTRDEFVAVLDGMDVRTFEPGAAIVTEGEVGTSMFALVEGKVDVLRSFEGDGQKKVAEMNEGDVFGEIALITDAPRLATVSAAERCVLLEFTRDRMNAIVAQHPHVGEVMHAFYRERLLANVLRSNPLFAELPDPVKEEVARAFVLFTAQPGEKLLEYGQPGNALFVLLRGRCLPYHPRADGGLTKYPEMREGDVFGEVSLLLRKDVTATVRAETPCTLLKLDRRDFERLVLSHPALKAELVRLSFERLQRTAKLLSGRFSPPGDRRV